MLGSLAERRDRMKNDKNARKELGTIQAPRVIELENDEEDDVLMADVEHSPLRLGSAKR